MARSSLGGHGRRCCGSRLLLRRGTSVVALKLLRQAVWVLATTILITTSVPSYNLKAVRDALEQASVAAGCTRYQPIDTQPCDNQSCVIPGMPRTAADITTEMVFRSGTLVEIQVSCQPHHPLEKP